MFVTDGTGQFVSYKSVISFLIKICPEAEQQKVNKHPKFDVNSDIQQQLVHFEYEMDRTLINILFHEYILYIINGYEILTL